MSGILSIQDSESEEIDDGSIKTNPYMTQHERRDPNNPIATQDDSGFPDMDDYEDIFEATYEAAREEPLVVDLALEEYRKFISRKSPSGASLMYKLEQF